MPQISNRHSGRDYWRSLDELADTPEFRHFMKEEFPGHNAALDNNVTRRSFLKIMGASLALAGLTSCRWPEEKIAPFAHRDGDLIPGKPRFFATTFDFMGGSQGLLVSSFDNRPVKIEGNPMHPHSKGKANQLAQASILEMYDPDRSRQPVHNSKKSDWAAFKNWAGEHFGGMKGDGEGLAVLSEQSSSPTYYATRDSFKKAFPNANWFEYEPVSFDNEREGARLAFGEPLRTVHDFAKAKRIVCLDADPLMNHPAMLKNSRGWAEGRRDSQDELSRMYCLESTYTVTGSVADHRKPVKASDIRTVASHLLALVGANVSGLDKFGHAEGDMGEFLKAMAEDLESHRGDSLIVAGPQQPAEVHALVHQLNVALGNVGNSVSYAKDPSGDRPSHLEAISQLADDMAAGRVKTLVMLGGNPVYDAPADLNFGQLLGNVENKVHLSLYEDETSKLCDWHLNRAHYLETWGDGLSWDGTYSIQQPLIAPLFDGLSPIELLSVVMGQSEKSGYETVRDYFKNVGEGDFEKSWREALHDGFVEKNLLDVVEPSINGSAVQGALAESAEFGHSDPHNLELVFALDYSVHDGRYANNAWLQEMPDPMTKLTWDNAAMIDAATAETLEIKTGDRVSISVEGREIKMAAYVMPGQAVGTVTLHLGYGRDYTGQVAEGAGFNVYPLRGVNSMNIATGAKMVNARGHYELASTQDHHSIDQIGFQERYKRAGILIREATLEEVEHDPEHIEHMGIHYPKDVQLWEPLDFDDVYKWGMTIDLNTCIGCGSCVVACQAENNIPVVGKEEVLVGREMHWMRIDRYYRGNDENDRSFENPKAVHQPMLCQHCENAPCESVCPVAATVHDDEGLNVMVYNRCIGTRYCSNNCPYKVRRFNYFNYQKRDLAGGYESRLRSMQYNPEVTIRSRGVMEKCTYCTQRIQNAKIDAKNEDRYIQDGEVVTACQQTCPTDAIVFGNLNDPNSRLSKNFASPRQYEVLAELNVKTRTRYLAKLNNPNPALVKEDKTAETNEHSTH